MQSLFQQLIDGLPLVQADAVITPIMAMIGIGLIILGVNYIRSLLLHEDNDEEKGSDD